MDFNIPGEAREEAYEEAYNKYKHYFKTVTTTPTTKSDTIKSNQIFISIASYRDPECPKTVENIINNATHPQNLTICVYEQNGPDDISVSDLDKNTLSNSNIILETVSYEKAMGPNWARYLIQKKWDNQEYYLQIDSHTMFVKDWDTILIKMLTTLPELSVLTQYPPEYDIDKRTFNTKKLRSGLYVEGINPKDGFTRIQSEYYKGRRNKSTPFKSEAWGACFSFSKYHILMDAPYDPYLPYLFFGEELDITLRLFTRGWQFFSPHKNVVFTSFKRAHRNTFWGDHNPIKRKEMTRRTRRTRRTRNPA
jgi:hypothetical protein